MKAKWRFSVEASIDEALLAVDLYNQTRRNRRLEGFLVHMHIAWLYLLQAEFQRDSVKYWYKLPNGRYELVDGERKTWDLQRCARERWPQVDAVRANLELNIGLRNKVEHRYEDATSVVTSGYAQALIINYENELTAQFGDANSLGEHLRFPIFVGNVTPLGQAQIQGLMGSLPASTRNYIAQFEADLDDAVKADPRYEFRLKLFPQTGAKTEADMAIDFVRLADLSDDEKRALEVIGKRTGTVVVREQVRPVSGAGMYRPGEVVDLVEPQIPFKFGVHNVISAWKKMECRPATGDANPERTVEKYCVYDQPHRDYVYTSAFVSKLVKEGKTMAKFKSFYGSEPVKRAATS